MHLYVGNITLRFEKFGEKNEDLGTIGYLKRMVDIEGYELSISAVKSRKAEGFHDCISVTGETYTIEHQQKCDSLHDRLAATVSNVLMKKILMVNENDTISTGWISKTSFSVKGMYVVLNRKYYLFSEA